MYKLYKMAEYIFVYDNIMLKFADLQSALDHYLMYMKTYSILVKNNNMNNKIDYPKLFVLDSNYGRHIKLFADNNIRFEDDLTTIVVKNPHSRNILNTINTKELCCVTQTPVTSKNIPPEVASNVNIEKPTYTQPNKLSSNIKHEINSVNTLKNAMINPNKCNDNNLIDDLSLPEINILKDKLINEINTIKETTINEKQVIMDKLEKNAEEKKQLRLTIEHETNQRNIFKSDKNTFSLIKSDLENNQYAENEIPILFAHKYPIFKILAEDGQLNMDADNNIDTEYILYKQLYDQCFPKKKNKQVMFKLNKTHKYAYLSPEEKRVYDEIIPDETSNDENSDDSNTWSDYDI